MGGNLFPNTSRLNKFQYDDLVAVLLNHFRTHLPNTRVDVIPAYRNKQSFGDIDIQIESTPELSNIRDVILDAAPETTIHKNGGVFSYAQDYWSHLDPFKGLITEYVQVDLITQSSWNYDTALSYYAYNDLGNLLGRIAHKLGFKLGHDGLSLILRDNTYQYAVLPVSQDFPRILEFLGFDPAVYLRGFEELEDVFEFATSSPFFNREIFNYDNRNHIARVRDKKRANYRAFLDYINTRTGLPAYPYPSYSELGGRVAKLDFMMRAFDFFPGLSDKYKEAEEGHKRRLAVRQKFNGDLVSTLTGLDGKDLGAFMMFLRNDRKFTDVDVLFPLTPLQINMMVMSYFEEYQNGRRENV